MYIEPNTKLQYKDGKRRITVHFNNLVDNGIAVSINIKQASSNLTFKGGYYNNYASDPFVNCDSGAAEYIRCAIAAAEQVTA